MVLRTSKDRGTRSTSVVTRLATLHRTRDRRVFAIDRNSIFFSLFVYLFARETFRLIDELRSSVQIANRWTIVWFGSIDSERASGTAFHDDPMNKRTGCSLAGCASTRKPTMQIEVRWFSLSFDFFRVRGCPRFLLFFLREKAARM